MLTIVWDVDDVLNDLMQAWLSEAWKPAHPECTLSYAEMAENPPDRVLGASRADYLASLDSFRLCDRGRCLRANPAVLDWLRESGARYRHAALTARPPASIPSLAEWLFRHFSGYLRTFGFVPSRLDPGMPVYERDKGEYLRSFGGPCLLIDDSEENVAAARRLGIRSVLYPQPWNRCGRSVAETLQLLSQIAEAN